MRKQEETTHSIDLQTLLKHLSRLVKWETFGALVGVPPRELRRIKEENGNIQSRVMYLLDYWVENDDKVSWSRVIEALKAIPEEEHLAENVSKTYGQTQALESSTDVAQIILKEDEELPRTLEEIRLKFTRLVLSIEKMLKKEVDFDDVLSFVCIYLHLTFEPQPENTRQLFSRLQPHYCFMSYKILKLIVLEFVEEAMGGHMEKYGNELSNWLESTTVQEFKAAVEKAANQETVDPSPSQCPIVLRLEGEWLEVTLKSLWKLLEYLFGKKSSILTRIKIDEGSVLVYLFAPQSEMLSLLALSSKKYEEMVILGIKSIEVGGLCFTSIYNTFDIPFTFETSLCVAIQNRCHSALIRFLLEIGTDPNGDNPGYTPLILAIILNNMEALSLLMEYNVDVFMFNSRQVSAIHMAAYNGNVDVVNSLLKAGVPPDHHDPFTKFTPLMAAASSNQKEIVKLLLQNGADKDFQSTDGYSALMFACKAGNVLTARVLIKAGANPNLKTIAHAVLGTEGGVTALYLVCCLYAEDTVKLLLEYHADPNISSDDGRTPLMAACFFRQYKVVNLLLQAGANVNSQTDHNQGKPTALMIAVYANDTTSVSLMLNANDIDVNLQDSEGRTALHWACRNGNNEMIEHLLKAKADPKLCTHDGESPLLVYIYSAPSSLAKPSIVAALLKAGVANAFKKTSSITPLHAACFCGQKDNIVQLLLKAKANVNALDIQGYTPLCIAAGKGHEKIVELLISAGADIELEKNIIGCTPLFFAVIMGHLEVVKILIQNGASIKRNRYGRTPQDYAAQVGHMEIFDYLSKASSKKTLAKAKKIISLDEGKTMKTVSKDDVQPSNDNDILSYYNNSFSSGPESIKQFQDNKKEYNLESLEATKSRLKIAS